MLWGCAPLAASGFLELQMFIVCGFGSAGVGPNEDSTLLLTWSVVWTMKKAGSGVLSSWLCRFPYAVLPGSNCTPDTMNALMDNFQREWEP